MEAERPSERRDVAVIEGDGFGFGHGLDYGSAHMGYTIYFFYGPSTLDCMPTPGERIKKLRKARQLTQPQLADLVEIDQSTVSDIERGAGFSAETLMRICEALEANPWEIMRGMGSTSPALKRAQDAAKKLTDEERSALRALLDGPAIPDDHVEERMPITKGKARNLK